MKPHPLTIVGADEDIPRLLLMRAKANGVETAAVFAPRKHLGCMVVVRSQSAHIWVSDSSDAPGSPALPIPLPKAVERIAKARAGAGEPGQALLRGTWRGELVLGEIPTIHLERKVAPYGTLSVWSEDRAWFASFDRKARWFSKPARSTSAQHATLEAAIRAGLAVALQLVGEACATRDTTRRAALDPDHAQKHPPKPKKAPTDPTAAFAPSKRDTVAKALSELGVDATTAGRASGPRLDRVVVRLAKADDIAVLSRKLDVLAFALGTPPGMLTMEAGPGDRQVSLFMPRKRETWKVPGLKELRKWSPPKGALPTCFGVDVSGAPRWLDLGESSHGHILIAGATGSGKSAVLHTVLCSLLLHRQVELVLIDPKQVELAAYSKLAAVASAGAAVEEALRELVAEMERRYTALAHAGLQHVGQQQKLKHVVVVVEELAELLMVGPAAQDLLVRLAQKGRAAGIHLVCTTQRPDATILSGLLRANLDTRIALNVAKAADSKIILDEVGAERLTRPGDLLLKVAGGAPERLHGVLLQPQDIASVVEGVKKPSMAA